VALHRQPYQLRDTQAAVLPALDRQETWMLAIVAAIIFAIAFLLDVTSTATNAVFAPASLLLLGLVCLALHFGGVGTSWAFSRRRR
jgi:hypothetical protein